MSFLTEVQAKLSKGLRKTETSITTLNGVKIKECLKDNVSKVIKNENSLTYIIDNDPDLSISHICDNLLLGIV